MAFSSVAFPWNRNSVLISAPNKPGVYAIWNKEAWIYIGETQDIQRRLLEHLDNTEACIHQSRPTVWGFELLQSEQFRMQRQKALIRELRPSCNQLTG